MCNPSQHPRPRDIEIGEASSAEDFDPLLPKPASPPSCATPSKAKNGQPRDGAAPPSADAGLGAVLVDALPPAQQMALLSFLMFLFFGMHNVLQEAIVGLLSRSDASSAAAAGLRSSRTLMLGYAEVAGVLFFSYLERTRLTDEGGWTRKAPLRAYPLLTGCLFASSSLSNLSLGYINFPTKVVFRSCKLVPTMIIATLVNRRVFKSYEYACALSICAGLVLFALADYSLDPLQFDPLGLLLVSGSVAADAVLPNAQERLFAKGSSRLEVTVYSNLFSFGGMTVLTLCNGSLFQFLRALSSDSQLATYFTVYAVLSYVSISCYMALVKRFGGVTAVVLTTARKAMTLVLSFLLFPKGFSWLYVYGSLLVLGAVMLAGICKKMGGKSGVDRQCTTPTDVEKPGRPAGKGRKAEFSSSGVLDGRGLEKSAEAILEEITKRAHI